MPGGDANIHPTLGSKGEPISTHQFFDRRRDSAAMALIRLSVQHDIPILGICRGMQEMNVALGGTLYQSLKKAGFPGQQTRALPGQHWEEKFREVHRATLSRNGAMHRSFAATSIQINSLHSQGVKQLGDGLRVEARHGRLVEAFSLPGHAFFWGVQWHAEIRADSPNNKPIWDRYSAAVEKYAGLRQARRSSFTSESFSLKAALGG